MMKSNGKTPAHQDVEQTLRNDFEFARTLEAATVYRDAEHRNWASAFTFGDALIEDCGPPGPDGVRNDSNARLVRAQEFLAQNGVLYSVEHLRELRRVAAKVPPGDRSPGVSWTVYAVAGNAETVEEVRKFAKHEDLTQVTVADVKKYLKKLRKDQKVQSDNEARQQWEKSNPGIPRPDPARVSATEKLLATAARVRALWIKVEKEFKDYPTLAPEEVEAIDAVLEVPIRLLEVHEGHDLFTGLRSWNG